MQPERKLNVKETYIKKILDEKLFVSIVSYSNFDSIQRFEFQNSLLKLGFKTKFVHNKRLKNTLTGSKYDNINQVFQGKVVLIYPQSSNDFSAQKELIKFISSSPQIFLLGCIVDGQYFQTPLMVKQLQRLPEMFENQVKIHQSIFKPFKDCAGLLNYNSQKLNEFLMRNSISLLNSLNSKL